MQKIAFFLYCVILQEKDLSELLTKSYRLGGSEFEFLIVSLLIEQRGNGIQSYLLSNYDGIVPHKAFHVVKDLGKSCHSCICNTITRIVIDVKLFSMTVINSYSKIH